MTYTSQKVSNNPLGSFLVAADRISNVDYQIVKLDIGAEGASSPITAANPLPITGSISSSLASATSATETLAAPTAVSSSVLASNSSRKGGWLKNVGDIAVWVSLSATAATSKPSKLDPGEVLQLASGAVKYTGEVCAITASGTGSLEVVEL